MTLYDKINKFIRINNYNPEVMYGTSNECMIKYHNSNSEYLTIFKHLSDSIKNKPIIWNHAEIKQTSDWVCVSITIKANSQNQ